MDFNQRPFTVIWENTRACDLACLHCRAEASPQRDSDELNFAEAQQLGNHTIPPANAIFKKNMAAVTEREYGDRVGIWRLIDPFDRYNWCLEKGY